MPTVRLDMTEFPDLLSEAIQIMCSELRKQEASDHLDASAVLTMLALGLHYWGTSRFLCACSETHIDGWIDEPTLALPLIDRNLLESAANILFMLEDPAQRGLQYFRGGCRDQKIDLDKSEADFGQSGNKEWFAFLKRGQDALSGSAKFFKISEEEILDPARIKSWPSFGQKVWFGYRQMPP